MKRILIVCPLCVLLLFSAGLAGEEFEQLREAFHGGRYEDVPGLAEQALRHATRADSAEILYYQASAERVAELAEIRMVELSRKFPKSPYAERALLWSAIYHFESGNLTKSEYLLRRILKDYLLTPLEPEVRLWLGRNYIRRGEYRSAKVELRHGLNVLPDFPRTPPWVEGALSFWLGEACERAEELDCARDAFHRVALREGEDPLAALAMVRLAGVLERLGEDREAGVWREKYEEEIDEAMLSTTVRTFSERAGPGSAVVEPVYESPVPESSSERKKESVWVQAGSFSSRANADQLEETLDENGFLTEVTRVRIDGNIFYRVRIGPFTDREAALGTLRTLRDIGVNGRILQGE